MGTDNFINSLPKLKRICFVLLIVFGTPALLRAQQGIFYNQYAHNSVGINPATSLLRPGGEVFFVGKQQWIGMDGAPTAFWGNVNIPLKSFQTQVGLNVRHENVAVERASEVSAFIAKSIRLSEQTYFGMSLNFGLSYYDGRFSDIDPQDPAFRDDVRELDKLIGAGFMLYNPNRYYIGFSLPRLMFSNLGNEDQKQYDFHNQYHLIGAGLVPLSDGFELRPSVMVSYSKNFRFLADMTAMLFVNRTVGAGISFKTNNEMAASLQFNVERFSIGYAYQFNLNNQLNRYIRNNTHELGFSFRFSDTKMLL